MQRGQNRFGDGALIGNVSLEPALGFGDAMPYQCKPSS